MFARSQMMHENLCCEVESETKMFSSFNERSKPAYYR
jgi:hypothetical protein